MFSIAGELIRKLGSGNYSCIAEAQNIVVVGQKGMECFGHVYHLETGRLHLSRCKSAHE